MAKGTNRMNLAILALPTEPLTIHASAARSCSIESAMTHCKAEWTRAFELAQKKGLPAMRAQRMAAVAYKIAMPRMTNLTSIKAAVACVAQGIQLEVFDGRDGSQMLYAAQVAISIHREKGKSK
jgi:hypothetical protein